MAEHHIQLDAQRGWAPHLLSMQIKNFLETVDLRDVVRVTVKVSAVRALSIEVTPRTPGAEIVAKLREALGGVA